MDASEAREHLEMVERIVAASSRRLEAGGEFFVVWGIVSAFVCFTFQMILQGTWPWAALWGAAAADVAAVVFSIVRSRYYRRTTGRLSFLEREYMNVLWLAFTMAFIVDILGFRIFGGWAQSAIWSVAETFVLFFIGMHGNPRALACGLVVVASIAVANYFAPDYAGYWLAGGMLIGYGGFGFLELLAQN